MLSVKALNYIYAPALAAFVFLAARPPQHVGADEDAPQISTPEQRLYVVDRDTQIPLQAALPARCDGVTVTFALYERGGAASVNTVVYPSAAEAVAASGHAASASIRLGSSLFTTADSVWPGVSGPCLERPAVSTGPSLLIGLKSEDPSTSTFVIPRASLLMGRDTQQIHTVLKVTAGGATCTNIDLDDTKSKDPAGNAVFVLGTRSQPAACGERGTLVQLYYPDGNVLFETRHVDPGTIQPFANLAPAAGPSTSGPLPPGTGTGGAAGSASGQSLLAIAALILILAAPILKVTHRRVGH